MAPDSKLFLHDHPISSYAQKVRIALRWKNIPFEHAIPPGMGSGNQEMKDFPASVHPRQEVPALIDGEAHIFDSTIILEYLEDKFPEPPLLPPRSDPAARARARMIEDLCDTHYEAVNWGYAEVTQYGRGVAEGVAEKLKTQAGVHTREVLAGAAFGRADVAVAPYLNRSIVYGFGPAGGSPLQQWHARISELPCVRETFAEYAAAARTAKMMAAIAGSPFQRGSGAKREYRDHRVEWILKSGGISIIESGLRDRNIRFSWPGPDPPE
ncbi:glutathione S-transferase [Hypoxylon argillaceum]|nr:glutathione S-transferase [Hypoxylon argillaceum]